MAILRSFVAILLTVVMYSTGYAAVIEQTKAKAVVTQEKAKAELVKGLERALKKEEKNPTSIEDLKAKTNKKVAKSFDKRRDLFNDIFKHEDQEKRLKKLDRKLKKLIKLDPTIAEMSEGADRVELLAKLEEKAQSLDQEEAAQLKAVDEELSTYATTADYLNELKSRIETDSVASISKSGRAIASIDSYDVYVGLYVLSALALIGLMYYLIISATAAIWAFSPALAIIFLIYVL